jgi:hypothetical protein
MIWRSFNRRHSERLAKGIWMLPMASSRAQRGCVYPGWTRGPAAVDSGVGYLAHIGSAGSCPRACRVGVLSIACCGAERELP